ncbi:hypothetical protein [Devosia sp. SD17-2]|uniref:hypothetical protein n=1 Tax=Devosia sp. SD17-2 TaxID=2976459 RepID=UPI0023D834B8|nr:hypothetical protein [Devosia sp. SD17-2]WEJ33046.1 hypothetical protein NYQ88_19655 [Devosia sp. SD17-2]
MIAATDTTALSECSALVFSPSTANTDATLQLCHRLGFKTAVRDAEIASIPADKIIFFLVHGALPDAQKQRLLQAIRSTNNPMRRFAPVVCLVPSGPRHQLVQLTEMGFDEVLFLSDPVEDMSGKLAAQLNHPLIYVKTAKYFGPDRRRIELVDRADPRRKHGNNDCHKIRVMRDPRRGISATDVL